MCALWLLKKQAHAMENRLVQISDFQQNVSTATKERSEQPAKKCAICLCEVHASLFGMLLSRWVHHLTVVDRSMNWMLKQQQQLVVFSIAPLSPAHKLNLTLIMTSRLKWPENISFAGNWTAAGNNNNKLNRMRWCKIIHYSLVRARLTRFQLHRIGGIGKECARAHTNTTNFRFWHFRQMPTV